MVQVFRELPIGRRKRENKKMKIKQIATILKAEKTIITFQTPSCQWLGNGSAFYPVYNLPILTQDNIFTIFDIAEDKRDKFYFEEREAPQHINLEDGDENEQILDRATLSIFADGRTLEPLKTSQGISFINKRYLKPFADEEAGYELYERLDKLGRSYFVAKSGFILLGVIMPYDLVNDSFIATLENWLELSRVAWFNKSQKRAEAMEQISLADESEEAEA